MNKVIKILLILMTFMLITCANDEFSLLSTNNIVPDKKTKPITDSFSIQNTIIIYWDRDTGADEYILYRSEYRDTAYQEVYRGKALRYDDYVYGYEIGKFFYYKLAKKRESVEFNKSDYAYGVVAAIHNDGYENNNSEKTSMSMNQVNNSLNANIYLYRDEAGNKIMDIDYYSITIDDNMNALMKIFFENNLSCEGVKLNCITNEEQYMDLSSGCDFKIINTQNYRNTLTFSILLDEQKFLSISEAPNGEGYKVLSYTLNILGIYPNNPQTD